MSLPREHKSQLAKIKSYLDPVLLNRGYTIFRDEKVDFIYYDQSEETYSFEVEGNTEPFYSVTICLDYSVLYQFRSGRGYIQFSDDADNNPIDCFCPYFEENLQCKHVAAAVYFLELTNGLD